jgi:hypothetical protein
LFVGFLTERWVGVRVGVAYIIELAYDLAIGTHDNIFEDPGFETPLGGWITN